MSRSAFLAVAPNGQKELAVMYADTGPAPALVSVSTWEQFENRFPKWKLLRVGVTWEQFDQLQRFREKRIGEEHDRLRANLPARLG